MNNAISDGRIGRAVLLSPNANTLSLAKKIKLTDPYEHTNRKQLIETLQMATDSILPVTATAATIEHIPPLGPINATTTDGSEIISTYEVMASNSSQSNLHTLKLIENKVDIGPTKIYKKTTTDVKDVPAAGKLITVNSKGVGQQILTASSHLMMQQQRLMHPQVSSATPTVVSAPGTKFAIIKMFQQFRDGIGSTPTQVHTQNQPLIHGQH